MTRIISKNLLMTSGLVTAGLMLLAGCSAGSSNTASEDAAAPSASEDLGNCGTLPVHWPEDPDGVLDRLPEEVRAAYNGYRGTLHASPWADWTPEGPGPYRVAIVFTETGPPYQAALLQETVGLLEADELIESVRVTEAGKDAATQVSNFQAAIRDGVDIILYQPVQADALTPFIDQAAEQGIPSIAMQGKSDSANSVDVMPNPYLLAARPAAEVVKMMGGEGTLLAVRGLLGTPIETESFAGIEAVVSECPGITLDGTSVVGNYSAATAKSEVQKYLSTHPSPLGGVIHSAIMGPGIIQAFSDSGRELPPFGDPAMTEGVAAYWNEHQSDFRVAGSGQGAAAIAGVIAEVTLRMLKGDGLLISDVVLEPPLVTEENIAEWAVGAVDLGSAASLEPPAGTYPPAGFIDGIFG